MPIYDYLCPNCELKHSDIFVHKFDEKVKCTRCRAILTKLFTPSTNVSTKVFPAEGIFLEHVSPTGQLFRSKNEMKEFEKKTRTTIGMLH